MRILSMIAVAFGAICTVLGVYRNTTLTEALPEDAMYPGTPFMIVGGIVLALGIGISYFQQTRGKK